MFAVRTDHRLRGATLNVHRDACDHGLPRARLRLVTGLHVGGATMPMEMLRRFEDKSDSAVLEGYGLSETSGPACFNRLARCARSVQSAHPSTAYRCGWSTNRRRGADRGTRRDTSPRAQRNERLLELAGGHANAIVDGWLSTGDSGGSTRTATSSLLPARAPDNPRRPLGPQDGPFTVGERRHPTLCPNGNRRCGRIPRTLWDQSGNEPVACCRRE